MFNNFDMKKFAVYTALTMVASFVLSAVIFFSTGGVSSITGSMENSKQNVNIEKVFNAAGINTISVDTASTDINVIPEDRSDIKVHLTGYTNSGEPELRAEQNGGNLDIYARSNKAGTSIAIISFDVINLRLDIYLPSDYMNNINIRTQSGDVDLGELNIENFNFKSSSGDFKSEGFTTKISSIETSSGNLTMNGFGGDLELITSSGDANIKYALKNSNANITTSSGNINLKNFTGDLKSRAQSGDITIDYAEFKNNIDMRSSSGNIELNLPSDSQFVVKVDTSSGDIRTDFPITQSGKIDDDKLEGSVGNSSNQMTIETSSGDVKIKKK